MIRWPLAPERGKIPEMAAEARTRTRYPYAYCELLKSQWVVQHCPYCGKQHYHDAGGAKGDPKEFLRHHVTHCVEDGTDDVGYILTDDASMQGKFQEKDLEPTGCRNFSRE
jgi:hypothetical protein